MRTCGASHRFSSCAAGSTIPTMPTMRKSMGTPGDDGDPGGVSFKSVTRRVDKGQPMTGHWGAVHGRRGDIRPQTHRSHPEDDGGGASGGAHRAAPAGSHRGRRQFRRPPRLRGGGRDLRLTDREERAGECPIEFGSAAGCRQAVTGDHRLATTNRRLPTTDGRPPASEPRSPAGATNPAHGKDVFGA